MDESFDPGALLAHSYALPRGPRVRLRLAQVRDLPDIRALLVLDGFEPDELGLAKLVRGDPRERIVICATALIGSSETVVGVGALQVGAKEPDVLLVDTMLTEGLPELLTQALVSRAAAIAGRRAA